MYYWRVKCLICLFAIFFGLPLTARAQATFYVPRVLAASNSSTGIALSNPSADRAAITMNYYGADGTLIGGPVSVNLEAASQIARLSTEFFPGTENQRGWVKISSNTADLTGFYLDGDFIKTADGAELAAAATGLTFPWIVQTASTNT